jgi:ATP-dependent Clp protease ATP-binding subunit ClpC
MVQGMERFSERARRVLEVAEEEARQLDHPYLGTEHLLLGLMAVGGPVHRAFVSVGATAAATRVKVAEAVGRSGSGQVGPLELSARARRAIDRASRLSLQRRDPQVDPEHLLVGVLDVEGRAGQALRGLGVDVGALGRAIDFSKDRLQHDDMPVPPVERTPGSPHCAVCGSSVDNLGLAYRIMAAEDEQGHRRNVGVTSCATCGVVLGTWPA